MDFDYSTRRIFNELVFKEFLEDNKYLKIYPKKVLDFGCGDSSLLQKIKENFPNTEVFCMEINNIKKKNIHYIENYKKLKSYKFDFIFFVDVLYLLPIKKIVEIFSLLKKCLNKGVIYILLGIYKESRGAEIFLSYIKKLNTSIYQHSINDLIDIFYKIGFEVFLKRLDYSVIFGIKFYPKDINAKEFLDYMYEDKILLKLTL